MKSKVDKYDELDKKVNNIDTTDTSDLILKTMAQKLVKLNRKYLIIIMINILFLNSLIN